ncbi:MAG: hypothetical protein ABIJ31_15020 [Pseudomonadota bacterium]
MSDPIIEEDSLISQDDIDKLLASSSIEEAQDLISDDDADELGELSQDDIDSLMNSNIPAGSGMESQADLDDVDDMELISQDDIDSLMNASVTEDPIVVDVDDGADELGELSQDDIDSLMNSNAPAVVEETPQATEDDNAGELSQEDIDRMLNPPAVDELSGSQTDSDDGLDDDDFEMISQDDINSLMSGRAEDSEVESSSVAQEETDLVEDFDFDPEPAAEPAPEELPPVEDSQPEPVSAGMPSLGSKNRADLDSVIDESEAMDVKDCFIAQDTLDDLIQKFDSMPANEPVVLEEDRLVVEIDPAPESEPDPLAQMSLDEEGLSDDALLDLGDMDDLAGSKPDDMTAADFDEEEVNQDDIDALLMESDEDEDDDILISQDDIDTLLMAADQEDEDLLGDMMDSDPVGDLDDDHSDDEDILENDAYDEDDEDQVVLAGDDEPVVKPVKKKAKKKIRGKSNFSWAKSRLVIACVSALVVLGIAIPAAYFLFFASGPEQEQALPVAALAPEPVVRVPVDTQREVEIETVNIQVQKQMIDKKPGNMLLKDFVILASDQSRELVYITADVSIDYSDQRAYHEIQNNLPFYRDLIYDSLRKRLLAENSAQTTEADMLGIVEATLKKVLPAEYIDRVVFKTFKAS